MTEKQRTITQNAAIHVYFDLLAQELNLAGYDMKRTLKESVDIPWNGATVKEYLWRPIQEVVGQVHKALRLTRIDPEFHKSYASIY